MFRDRIEAGQRLADALQEYKGKKKTIVMALPRGGIVPAYIIAKEQKLPLGVIMVKKIGHPFNPEYAIGAVSMTGIVLDEHSGVSEEYIDASTAKLRSLLKERYKMYLGDKPSPNFKGKCVIVVDDGVATGKTLIAALELIKKENPQEIIVAVPVGPNSTIHKLKSHADKVLCLESYDDFYAIGLYYEDFNQVSDEEVKEYLKNAEGVLSN